MSLSANPVVGVPVLVTLALLLAGCPADDDDAVEDDDAAEDDDTADDDAVDDDDTQPPPEENWDRDIVATALTVDLETLEASATLQLAESEATSASFEAGGITVLGVRNADGPLVFAAVDEQLDVALPAGAAGTELQVDYTFAVQPIFQGYMEGGSTLLWPYWCGNLFPCHSDPTHGLTFQLEVTGVPEGQTAVYPQSIAADAPSYQIAWTVGDYTEHLLGATTAGTEIKLWSTPATEAAALDGTAELVEIFQWFEETLGPYPFGQQAGVVEVDWGAMGGGGMEHHPFWHVSTQGMEDRSIHAHEAAHGWFGDGVRIACWEDLVLSEGTVTYLTPRVIGQVVGPDAEQAIWDSYAETVELMIAGGLDDIAWPDSCGEVDVLEGTAFFIVPYMKGAYFYKALADEIGAETLDAVLGSFFVQHAGEAAGMQELLDTVLVETGFDPTALADAWLRSEGIPD